LQAKKISTTTTTTNNNNNNNTPMQHITDRSTDSPTINRPTGTDRLSFFAKSHKTTRFAHSPMVYAMIKGSRMDNCDDVEAIWKECEATNADDSICRTAEMYLSNCLSKSGKK